MNEKKKATQNKNKLGIKYEVDDIFELIGIINPNVNTIKEEIILKNETIKKRNQSKKGKAKVKK